MNQFRQPTAGEIANPAMFALKDIMKRVPCEVVQNTGVGPHLEIPGREILGPRPGLTLSYMKYNGDYALADSGGAMIYRGHAEGAIAKAQAGLHQLLGVPRLDCHYCNVDTEIISGAMLYSGRPDLQRKIMYRCPKCLAYVGSHDKTRMPLGTVARAPLRKLRKQCHEAFDRIWKREGLSRSDAYAWLADSMGIPAAACHIAMFDEEQCRLAIELSKRFAA